MTKELKKVKRMGNEIIAIHTRGYITYGELQNMYTELEKVGITTGALHNDNKTCEWYYNGIEMEDSLYYYSMYKSETGSGRIEITAYLS